MAQMQRAIVVSFLLLAVTAAIATRSVSTAAAPKRVGKRYYVGGPDGWRVPPPTNVDMYVKWAAGVHLYVEDSIEFVYKNDSVVNVDKYGYYHCNGTAFSVSLPPKKGTSLFLLSVPGVAYFSSADVNHCKMGQRLMINVEPIPSPAPAPAARIKIAPVAAPSFSSAPSPVPQEPAGTTSAATTTSGYAPVLAMSTSLAMLGLILGVW